MEIQYNRSMRLILQIQLGARPSDPSTPTQHSQTYQGVTKNDN